MRKLVSVQYVRAVAALLVVASHALLYPLTYQDMFDERIGWLGVILFFAVSGFIMVSVTGRGSFDPLSFMKRRVLRIVPLYWLFTFLAAALALLLPNLFKTTVFDLGQLMLSLLFLPFHNPASHGFHPLYKLGWTLNYEMFFYVCFALLAFVNARARVGILTLCYGLLALYGFVFLPETAFPGFYTSYMPLAFVVGAWLGLLYNEGVLAKISPAIFWGLVAAGVIALLEGFITNADHYADPVAFIGLVSFSGIVVALLVAYADAMPRNALLEYLGDASYSIYLAHIFAIGLIEGVMLRLVGSANVFTLGLAVVGAIVGGTTLGVLVYEVVEKPLMQRLRKFH